MAINYPDSLDTFTNPSAGNTLDSPSHSGQHTDINDAVEALEAKVGIGASPAGSATAGQVLTAQGGGTALWETPDAGGLVFLKTQSFTTAASVQVDDIFSNSYRNYKIILNAVDASGNNEATMRLRSAGTSFSGSNYIRNYIIGSNTSISGGRATSTAFAGAFLTNNNGQVFSSFEIQNPYQSGITVGYSIWGDDPTNILRLYHSNYCLTDTSSYDGFEIIASATITGSVSIYGYRL